MKCLLTFQLNTLTPKKFALCHGTLEIQTAAQILQKPGPNEQLFHKNPNIVHRT